MKSPAIIPAPSRPPSRASRAFSLVELLLSITVLSILLLMIVSLLETTQRTWSSAKTRVAQFRDARIAFETLTRNISQATLNTYFDYYDKAGNRVIANYGNQYDTGAAGLRPHHYDRYSELEFLVDEASTLLGATVPTTSHAIFFQAPLGDSNDPEHAVLDNLLNTRGYFVLFTDDSAQRPAFLRSISDPKYRFRLMEYRPPTEENRIYVTPDNHRDWFDGSFSGVLINSRVIADNVIALVIAPMTSSSDVDPNRYDIAPNYAYDTQSTNRRTRHQLPPMVRITMVAMDEASAQLLDLGPSWLPSDLVPDTLFKKAADFEADLEELEEHLANQEVPINYRVFSGVVSIRGSKWSDENLVAVP